MVQASEAFRQAVRDGAFQRAILRFPDFVLTNEDISITSGGLDFWERFNFETDLTVGEALSATLHAYVVNRNRLLNDFEFGEYTAQIGATVSDERYERVGNVTAVWNGRTYTGQDTTPYLMENGAACSVQPGFPVKSIVIDNGKAWLFGEDRAVYAFTIGGGVIANPSASIGNEHMWRKVDALVAERRGLALSGQTETEWLADGRKRTLEFVKLGTFFAERPSVLQKDIIELDSNDRMKALDDIWIRDVPVNYPTTLGALAQAICNYANVPLVSSSFTNSDMAVASRPDKFDNATARETIAWIAEAACSFARFDRDGRMEFVWFQPTQTVFDEHDYSDFTPYSYSVQPVTQLYVRNADSTVETRVGSGDNVYLIQDNPFLRQDDGSEDEESVALMAAEPRAATPNDAIYNRLSGFEPFNPSTADLFTDWSMQAGDIVTVKSDSKEYKLPVYSMNMNWRGAPKIVAESTGNETRKPPDERERASFETNRAVSGLGGRAKSLENRMTWAEVNIDENKGFIQLTAGKLEEAEGRLSQAEIDIDGANADIKLWAQRTEENGEKISQAQIDIDGANAAITLQASRTDAIEGRVSSAEIAIDGANAAIALKVDRNGVIAAINLTPEEALIQASKINLVGYVTASELDALKAQISNLTTGVTFADDIWTKSCRGTNLSFNNVSVPAGGTFSFSGSTFNFGDYEVSWKSRTVVTSGTVEVTLNVGTSTLYAYLTQNATEKRSFSYVSGVQVKSAVFHPTTGTIYYLGR